MTDEKYLFVTDVADKKRTARGSHNKRTHCGRGGRVRLPSDNLTRKELNKMNGDVKSYRLNEPMTWAEFKTMPDDLKITYIKLLREKFNVPGTHIEKMLGTNHVYYSKEIVRLGLSEGKSSRSGSTPWDRDGWNAWCNRTTSANEEQEEIPALRKSVILFPSEPNRQITPAVFIPFAFCPSKTERQSKECWAILKVWQRVWTMRD